MHNAKPNKTKKRGAQFEKTPAQLHGRNRVVKICLNQAGITAPLAITLPLVYPVVKGLNFRTSEENKWFKNGPGKSWGFFGLGQEIENYFFVISAHKVALSLENKGEASVKMVKKLTLKSRSKTEKNNASVSVFLHLFYTITI